MYRLKPFEKLLILFFAFIGALITIRVFYSDSGRYVFLVWNLFLAWIPMFISNHLNKDKKWQQMLLFGSWLLFFPNSLYIITDLIHLEVASIVPKWFDAILLFLSSFTGLAMAFISLNNVERYLSSFLSKQKVAIAMLLLLFVGSFGVYLGRFLRWNSWDIIRNPFSLINTIAERFIFPTQHLRTWSMTFILTGTFYLLYMAIKKLPDHLNRAAK
jgi:uncharacterized membrane protein